MKENNKQVVFYSAEKDGFLGKYKDRGSLAFEAGFSEDLENALSMPLESYEDQKDELDKLAELFGCEVLNVEVVHPCAILANGPPCTSAGVCSSVWIRFGFIASFNKAAIAPTAFS